MLIADNVVLLLLLLLLLHVVVVVVVVTIIVIVTIVIVVAVTDVVVCCWLLLSFPFSTATLVHLPKKNRSDPIYLPNASHLLRATALLHRTHSCRHPALTLQADYGTMATFLTAVLRIVQ